MSRTSGTFRFLLPWMALVPLLSGCQSIPATDVSISSKSSLLAVDVLFPVPLGRDPSLVQAFFVRGPIHGGLEELPELISASFVKWDRAYLLDPEPGTYFLVAVTSAVAPPRHEHPVAGVTHTRWSGTIAHATIFPAELIHRTRTTIAPGGVAFMGALRLRQGDRINANAVLQDDLQKQIAERIRPGATSESGVAGWFARTWMVDLEKTSLSNEASDQESFFDDALTDLGDSPWARVIARAAPRQPTAVASRTPAPSLKSTAPIPEAVAAKPQSAAPDPKAAAPKVVTPVPEASRPSPKRQRVLDLPPSSPLAKIELGMSHEDVRRILGAPDDRINRITAKAWIPFYTGPGTHLRDWIYEGEGRVVFSLDDGALEVLDVVYDPDARK